MLEKVEEAVQMTGLVPFTKIKREEVHYRYMMVHVHTCVLMFIVSIVYCLLRMYVRTVHMYVRMYGCNVNASA